MKKQLMYKIAGGTALVTVPTATTLGVALGIKDESVDMTIKPAKTAGEKFFDENIAEGSSTFVSQHLLNPDLTKGHDISYLSRLDINMESVSARKIIAKETNGEPKPALASVEIRTDNILNPSEVPDAFIDANTKLYDAINDPANSGKNMAVYIGKDLKQRTIIAKLYEIKGLATADAAILNEYLSDMGNNITDPVSGHGTNGGNAGHNIVESQSGQVRQWSKDDGDNFLNMFAGENQLLASQNNYYPGDGAVSSAIDFATKWGELMVKPAQFNAKRPLTDEVLSVNKYSIQQYNNSLSADELKNQLNEFVDSKYMVGDKERNIFHSISTKLAKNNLTIQYRPIVNFKDGTFKIYAKFYKLDENSKVLFLSADSVVNPIAMETKLWRTFPLSKIGTTVNVKNTANRAIIRKFLTEDVPKYLKSSIVKPGLQTLGKQLPSLKTTLDKFITLGEVLSYKIGNTNPYQDILKAPATAPQADKDAADAQIDKILDAISSKTFADSQAVIDQLAHFGDEAFNSDNDKNFWTNLSKLMENYYFNGGQYKLYTLTSGLASFIDPLLDDIYSAHPDAKTIIENSSIIDTLLIFLKRNGIIPQTYELNDIISNPIREAHAIAYKLGQKNVKLPNELIGQILPILSGLPGVGSVVTKDNQEKIIEAIATLTTNNRLSEILKIFGSDQTSQLGVIEKLVSGGDDLWDALEQIASSQTVTREQIDALFKVVKQTGLVPSILDPFIADTPESVNNYVKMFNSGAMLEIVKLARMVMKNGLVNVDPAHITIKLDATHNVDLNSSAALTNADKAAVYNWFTTLPDAFRAIVFQKLADRTDPSNPVMPWTHTPHPSVTDKTDFTDASLNDHDASDYFNGASFDRSKLDIIKSMSINPFSLKLFDLFRKLYPVFLGSGNGQTVPAGKFDTSEITFTAPASFVLSELLNKSLTDGTSWFSLMGQFNVASDPNLKLFTILPIVLPLIKTAPFDSPQFSGFAFDVLQTLKQGIGTYFKQPQVDASGVAVPGKTMFDRVMEEALHLFFPSGFVKGDATTAPADTITYDQGRELVDGLLHGFSDFDTMWNSLNRLITIPASYDTGISIPFLGEIVVDVKGAIKSLFDTGKYSMLTISTKDEIGHPIQKLLRHGLLSLTKADFKSILDTLNEPLKGIGSGSANGAISGVAVISRILAAVSSSTSQTVADGLYNILQNPIGNVPSDEWKGVFKVIDALQLLGTKKLEPLANVISLILNTGITSVQPSDIHAIASIAGLSSSIESIINKVFFGSSPTLNIDIDADIKKQIVNIIIPSEVTLVTGARPLTTSDTFAALKNDLTTNLATIRGAVLAAIAPTDSAAVKTQKTNDNNAVIQTERDALTQVKMIFAKMTSYNQQVRSHNEEINSLRATILNYKTTPATIPAKLALIDPSIINPPAQTLYDNGKAKLDAITGATPAAIKTAIDGMTYQQLVEVNNGVMDIYKYNGEVQALNDKFTLEKSDVADLMTKIPADIALETGATAISTDYATLKAKLDAFTSVASMTEAQLVQYRKDYLALEKHLRNVKASNDELHALRTEVLGLIANIPAETPIQNGADPVTTDYATLVRALSLTAATAPTASTADLKQYKVKYKAIETHNTNVAAKNKELSDLRAEATALVIPTTAPAIEAGADQKILHGKTFTGLKGLLTAVTINTASTDKLREYKANFQKLTTLITNIGVINSAYTSLKTEVSTAITAGIPAEVTLGTSISDAPLKGVTYAGLKSEWDALVAKNIAGITLADLTQLKTDLAAKLKEITKFNENVGKLNNGQGLELPVADLITMIKARATLSGRKYVISHADAVTKMKELYDAGMIVYTTKPNGNPGYAWLSLKVSTADAPISGQHSVPWSIMQAKLNGWGVKGEFTIDASNHITFRAAS